MVHSDLPKGHDPRKPYHRPTAIQLTPDEAKRKLIDHATRGDHGARELLEMIFPEEAKKTTEEINVSTAGAPGE